MFTVENLKFRYPGNTQDVVNGISFEIKKGEIFGFLGPSGAGKSTTQKVLIKILKDFRGSIKYNGKNITEYGDDFYEGIGVSFESNAYRAAMYGMDILTKKEKVGELKVGLISPPDIAISFKIAKKIGLKIPFSFFESANIIYDYYGVKVRDKGQKVVNR